MTTIITITDHDVLKIITHFFPAVDVVENKYVLNIQCTLWDKSEDIDSAINSIKKEKENEPGALLSIGEIYDYYVKFCTNNNNNSDTNKFVVSKRYFEKYVCAILSDNIVFDNFISWH